MGNLKNKNKITQMKFSALIATAAAVKIAPHKHGLSMAQMKNAVQQDEEYSTEDVFNWFDRDGSGTVDVYEFIFGIGWICGYHEYEPTEEDVGYLMMFWEACDTNGDDELTLEEVYAFEEANGY